MHLVVDSSRDRVIAPFLMQHKIWEPSETAILCQLLRPGHNVIDVGANIGYYTVMFSKLVGPSGWVHSFEPEPNSFRLLSANLLINDCTNVSCENRAVSDITGDQDLYLSDVNLGDHRLFPCEGRASCSVETTSLDETLPWQQIDFVKIDTQGAEPRILAGMHQLIERSRGRLGCLWSSAQGC